MEYHNPVLLKESLELLSIKPNGIYVDVTFGGGGHSSGILKQLNEEGRLYAFDKDEDAAGNRISDKRFCLIRSDFRFIEKELSERSITAIDGLLADLGISSHQINDPSRGFSYRFNAELDMRMDNREESSATHLLNTLSELDLKIIFGQYGELDRPGKIAREIVALRQAKPIVTTHDLEQALKPFIPRERAKFLSKVYQALRIAVNDEMEGLKELLDSGLSLLAPKGRLVVIAYHSLEDRMVKQFFKYGNFVKEDRRDIYGNSLNPLQLVTRHAVVPSETEIEANPRARSAKLRAAEKR